MQVPVSHIEKAAMESLTYYDWPGNIRELENCVIQTLVNSTSDTIRVEDIPGHLSSRGQVVSKEALRTWDPDMDFRELDAMVSDYTRQVMIAAIQRCAGNKQEAAKLLGVKRATFYYRLKELGIQ
jgi:DNA-binding NtrC family response regulator